MENALNDAEKDIVMEETLRKLNIEITIGYGFAAGGKQSFELYSERGTMASKLIYPNSGEMFVLKGEVDFWSKFFLGGKFTSSNFIKRPCTDEDWDIFDPAWGFGTNAFVDYQITRQMSKSKVESFDINLYGRLLDIDKNQLDQNLLLSQQGNEFLDFLLIDKLAFDAFIGYQHQQGRSKMIDPMIEYLRLDEGLWYTAVGLPYDLGLDSSSEIKYYGPRIGLRAVGSKGKFTTKIGFSYAYLQTRAEGWWNLRNLSFWQKGEGDSGLDLELETSYMFNPHLSLGVGFNFNYRHQEKLTQYAQEDGIPWWDGYQDRIRNADSLIYFPVFLLKVIW